MPYELREMDEELKPQCMKIFNDIIEEGLAFAWETPYNDDDWDAHYKPGQPIWCAVDTDGNVLGFVHVKPNGEGRMAHIANNGYNVAKAARGQGVGKALVAKAIEVAREMGYRGIQYNAVVSTNIAAVKLYESFGFSIIGTVPRGFRQGTQENPHYVDHHIMFLEL